MLAKQFQKQGGVSIEGSLTQGKTSWGRSNSTEHILHLLLQLGFTSLTTRAPLQVLSSVPKPLASEGLLVIHGKPITTIRHHQPATALESCTSGEGRGENSLATVGCQQDGRERDM